MFMVSALSWMLANRAIIRATILEERNREFQVEQENRIRTTRKKFYCFMVCVAIFMAYKMI